MIHYDVMLFSILKKEKKENSFELIINLNYANSFNNILIYLKI